MTSKKYLLLYVLPLFLYLGFPAFAHAYLTDNNCVPLKKSVTWQLGALNSSKSYIKSSDWNNLQPGQYLYIGYTYNSTSPSIDLYLKLSCPNLGVDQDEIEFHMEVTNSSSSYVLAQESSIIGAKSNDDRNKSVAMYKTNTPGVFYAFNYYYGPWIPFSDPMRSDWRTQITLIPNVYITKDYQWGGKSNAISITGPVTFRLYDAKDGSVNASDKGYVDDTMTSARDIPAGYINIASSCNYSLSTSTLDFGDQNLSKITNDKKTTVKKTITLNMKDCYGVNKVKTYISNAPNTLENGLLLGNNVTTNAATNVGIGMSVGSSYTENPGESIYMDGTHALEWNFDEVLTMQSVTKEIPLDIFLLKSGGAPTTGSFNSTASITLDFI